MLARGWQVEMKTFLCLLLISITLAHASKQFVDLKGFVRCDGKPKKLARVDLFEEDLFSRDHLATDATMPNGEFTLHGYDYEISYIDPVIEFTGWCGKCNHQLKIYVPTDFIHAKRREQSDYIGKFDLAEGKKLECVVDDY